MKWVFKKFCKYFRSNISIFHPLEVVERGSKTYFQVDEKKNSTSHFKGVCE